MSPARSRPFKQPFLRCGAITSRAVSAAAWTAIVVMLGAALADIVREPAAALAKSDFRAFYCGARVASHHGDPYALTDLRACEWNGVANPGGALPSTAGIDPDPVPGFQMALFLPFTLLPMWAAALGWDALLIASLVATSLITSRLTGLRPVVIAAILSFIGAATSIPFGETAPVVTLGCVLAAFGLARNRAMLTLCGAALTMLVPQVGLPVCGSILIWRPSLRLGIAAVGAVLAALSIGLVGIPLNIEYLFVELPVHAIAEGTTSIQYSLAWLLHFAGVQDAVALRVASVQYVVFAALGIAFARRVAWKLGTPAALALFPPVMVLIGGSFIHLQQMAVAVPFGILLATRTNDRRAWLALMLLVLPWPAQTRTLLFGASAIAVTIALVACRGKSMRTALGVACGAALVYGLLAGPVVAHVVPAEPQRLVSAPGPLPLALNGDRLASAEDAREVRSQPELAVATPRTLATRLPIWMALGLMVSIAAAKADPQGWFTIASIALRRRNRGVSAAAPSAPAPSAPRG